MRIDEREGIQLPHVARVAECAEVAPVDFESFSGQRFHADESPFGSDVWAHIAHVLPQDAVTSLISRSVELLLDDGSAHAGIFLQPFGDSALEWIELAFAVPQFLLLTVMLGGRGALLAVLFPVTGMACAPFTRTVPAQFAVFRVGGDLLSAK